MQTFFISVGFRWTEMNVNGVGVFLVHSRVNQNFSSSLDQPKSRTHLVAIITQLGNGFFCIFV